jgi:hypothetical protein
MRKPRIDHRWDRTPTGLIVPRRPTLPTRRFLNPLGSTSCECCGVGVGCQYCGYHDTDDILVTVDIDVSWSTCTLSVSDTFALVQGTCPLSGCTWSYQSGDAQVCAGVAKFKFALAIEYLCGDLGEGSQWRLSGTVSRALWEFIGWGSWVLVHSVFKGNEVTYTTADTGDCLTRALTDISDPLTFPDTLLPDYFLSGVTGTGITGMTATK